jgi:MFS family permease
MVPLGAVVASLPAGILTDQIGFRYAGGIGLLVAAILGALRGACATLPTLMATVLVFGMGVSFIWINTPKALGYYFPPKLLGTAMGVNAAGMFIGTGLGTTLAAKMSGTFGGWENTMYYLGIVTGVLAVIWLTTVKVPKLEAPGMPGSVEPGFSKGMKAVIRTKDVWVLAWSYFLTIGSSMAMMGYLPTFFAEILGARGYPQPTAVATGGMIAGMLSWGMVIGNVLWPATSDKIGLRKVVVVPGMLLTGLFNGLAFVVGPPALWALTFVWGLVAGVAPLMLTIPIEHPRIGPALAGSAAGLLMLLGQIGGFVGSSVGSRLLGAYGPGVLFAWAVLWVVLGGILLFFVTETGPRTRAAKPGGVAL